MAHTIAITSDQVNGGDVRALGQNPTLDGPLLKRDVIGWPDSAKVIAGIDLIEACDVDRTAR